MFILQHRLPYQLSFNWVTPMVIVAGLLFFTYLFIGIGKRILSLPEILKGFIPFLGSLLSAGVVTFLGWKLPDFYPQYNDLLNGLLIMVMHTLLLLYF
jgi:hypothetical protein